VFVDGRRPPANCQLPAGQHATVTRKFYSAGFLSFFGPVFLGHFWLLFRLIKRCRSSRNDDVDDVWPLGRALKKIWQICNRSIQSIGPLVPSGKDNV
jgi:hypothetical protein